MNTPNKREREQKRDQKAREKEQRRRDKRFEPRRGPEITTAAELIGAVPSIEEVMRSLEPGNRANRSAAPIPLKLFVGSLSDITTSAGLRKHFEPHGPLVEAVVITNRETGATRNFGFVTLVDRKDGARTIDATHHSELDGNRIVVNIATDR
jgi:hypothetical protein